MLVQPLSARFLCFRVDGKKGVGTNIIVSEGMASKGDEVMLGAGRGCMMKQRVKLKQIRAPMMTHCSCCEQRLTVVYPLRCQLLLAMETLQTTTGHLVEVEGRVRKGRSQGIVVGRDGQ